MTQTMDSLIEAHRRALAEFERVVDEEHRAEQADILTKRAYVDLLIAADVGECCVIGSNTTHLRRDIEEAYQSVEASIWFLQRYDRAAFDTIIDLLAELKAKNLAMVDPAYKAWIKDRAKQVKDSVDIAARCEVASNAEKQAALALLLHQTSDPQEQAERAEYVRKTQIFFGCVEYGEALLKSLAGIEEEDEECTA